MEMTHIHDLARRLVGVHGDRAELEAAQKATECDRQGAKQEALDWRRVQTAIREMRGPRAT
jgi:hypothetical protein